MNQSRIAEMLVSVVFSAFFAGVGVAANADISMKGWVSWVMAGAMTFFVALGSYAIYRLAGEEE